MPVNLRKRCVEIFDQTKLAVQPQSAPSKSTSGYMLPKRPSNSLQPGVFKPNLRSSGNDFQTYLVPASNRIHALPATVAAKVAASLNGFNTRGGISATTGT
jgi:hypothetical protein